MIRSVSVEKIAVAEGRPIEVEQFGDRPRSLFVSGFHGHEYQAIGRLRTVLNRTLVADPTAFGPHLRILNMHPSAIAARTRTSPDGTDANRIFPSSAVNRLRPEHPFAHTLMDAVKKHALLQTVWSFHGNADEPGRPSQPFHLYDTPRFSNNPTQPVFDQLARKLLERVKHDRVFAGDYPSGVYTGVDCDELGNHIQDGYIFLPADTPAAQDGTFEDWAASSLAFPQFDRALTFEIPTYLPIHQQQRLISLVVHELVIPYQHYLLSLPLV